ncbi:hypothetical protein GQ43DRAFT_269962 [Delitschia confertaspora ATCC 74209]|uniref:Uncharacterized protein n=1 Tax=Delitschia confertaspora ATCC 74209 TaxID=1513339 RepID=A0A9P4JYT0_9PLEO|nr:hypothetical protein GQ43DRAFT_269962 [Delitschia confertaspora ATCC 74209]
MTPACSALVRITSTYGNGRERHYRRRERCVGGIRSRWVGNSRKWGRLSRGMGRVQVCEPYKCYGRAPTVSQGSAVTTKLTAGPVETPPTSTDTPYTLVPSATSTVCGTTSLPSVRPFPSFLVSFFYLFIPCLFADYLKCVLNLPLL